MNYELAKELRDAGFPQTGNGSSISPPDALVMRRGDRIYSPTLSELILACGKPFKLEGNSEIASEASIWVAESNAVSCNAATPDEAVGRLWLALRKGS
jgi:hypothetical protein